MKKYFILAIILATVFSFLELLPFFSTLAIYGRELKWYINLSIFGFVGIILSLFFSNKNKLLATFVTFLPLYLLFSAVFFGLGFLLSLTLFYKS